MLQKQESLACGRSSLREPRLVHHPHGILDFGEGLLGNFVRALVALVENVLDVVEVVLVLATPPVPVT